MMRYIKTLLLCLGSLSLLFSPAHAQSTQNTKSSTKSRPKIGLVLGGGGAKGLAHAGVIKVLEDNHIPIDVISGTSMGAIVGSLYASGYTADELVDVAQTLDWNDVFNDKTSRGRSSFRRKADEYGFLTDYKVSFKNGSIVLPKGIIQGQNLFLAISRLLAKTRSVGKFENLPIPFRLVATDLGTGKAVVMTDGDLATAVFASMAIPGFIPPVQRDGKYLIDGGLVNNVPVNLARQLGADIVIVVNVGTDAKPASEMSNFIDVLRQTQILLTQDNTNFQIATLNSDDILMTPDLKGLGAGSFGQAANLVEKGQATARLHLDALTPLKLNDQDWAQHIAARTAAKASAPQIAEVRITQDSKLSDKVLRAGISLQVGERLNAQQLNKDIDKLYGNGVFDRITYKLTQENENTILEIAARAKESSDGYFKFGVSLDSNMENNSSFQLGVSYTKPQINTLGGEWRTEVNFGDSLELTTEFYQPIGASQRFFVEPSLFLQRDKDDFFDDEDRKRGEIKTLIYSGLLQGGALLGRWGEISTGLAIAKAELGFTDDTLGIDKFSFQDSFWRSSFTVDQLDSLAFPTKGGLLIVTQDHHGTFLKGELEYDQLDITGFKPFTKGRHTFGLGTQLSGVWGDDINFASSNEIGGFLNLSGFSEAELSGQYSGTATATYYYRLNQQAPLFDTPMYIGASLEAGNVFQNSDDIKLENLIYAGSIYAGMKTPIGPIFIGVGHNDTGSTSLYFSIGSFF